MCRCQTAEKARMTFITKFAKALVLFGAPSHRLESMLNSVAHALSVKAQFIQVPGVILVSFGDPSSTSSKSVFIKANQGLDLGKAQTVHEIYRDVAHDTISATEGERMLDELMASG